MAFRFKQFSIDDAGCTLKVGTDGVLLGAWADVSECKNILDIGTGSGLIALMLAQRCNKAHIEAVEIDSFSAEKARRNIFMSPWKENIILNHASVQEYARKEKRIFDLIVCSPPYFRDSMKPKKRQDLFSKHDDNLSYETLLAVSFNMLHTNGKFCLILPASEEKYFKQLASAQGFYITRIMHMFPVRNKIPKRVLMQFEKSKKQIRSENITVLESPAGDFTQEYSRFTQEFYLNF